MNAKNLIPYAEVEARIGIARRTLQDRIASEGITVYIDGRDRRRRLIDVRDLPKLMEPRPVERRPHAA